MVCVGGVFKGFYERREREASNFDLFKRNFFLGRVKVGLHENNCKWSGAELKQASQS